jgi:DNA polymerase III epsilon subunit-like protein
MSKFEIYVVDTETTGLNAECDIIELSIIKLSNDEQKTWHIKPLNIAAIQPDALRINHHKLEDILHQTKVGKDLYREPNVVIAEIENWLMEDFLSAGERIIAGQNIKFDIGFLNNLWKRNGSEETYPFNNKYSIDTMQIEFFLDYCKGEFAEGYSLFSLAKKYGVKNEKAHSAAADTLCTANILNKQIEIFKTAMNK